MDPCVVINVWTIRDPHNSLLNRLIDRSEVYNSLRK